MADLAHGSTGAFSLELLSLDSESHDPGLPSHCSLSAYRRIVTASYLPLELRGAAHARLVAPSLAIPLRARLSVGRSAARGTRPRRESDPSLPAQAPESPHFPRNLTLRGGARRDARERPPTAPAAWLPVTTTNLNELLLLTGRAANRDQRGFQDPWW